MLRTKASGFDSPLPLDELRESSKRADMKLIPTLLLAPLLFVAASPVHAQDKPRVSPTDTVATDIGGAQVKIVYSRPYTKDPKTGEPRKIWGGLVPFGQVWRTGANEATTLTTDKPLVIGGTAIPAGTYTLFSLPAADGAKLIVNKQTGQWGTKYDEKQDLARIDMKKEPLGTTTDQFTIAFEKSGAAGSMLKLTWEDTQYSVPVEVGK